MEEDIEHLKDIKENFDYNVKYRTSLTEEYLNAHRKSLAIQNILNELDRIQKDNQVLFSLSKKYFMELEKLKKENTELRKGQHSLMQSRKKLKDRYYKLQRDFRYIEHEHDRLDKRNNELLEENKELKKYTIIQDTDKLIINGVKFNFEDYIQKSIIQDKIRKNNLLLMQGVATIDDRIHLNGEIFALQELLEE